MNEKRTLPDWIVALITEYQEFYGKRARISTEKIASILSRFGKFPEEVMSESARIWF